LLHERCLVSDYAKALLGGANELPSINRQRDFEP